jgi:hypothetical protein
MPVMISGDLSNMQGNAMLVPELNFEVQQSC